MERTSYRTCIDITGPTSCRKTQTAALLANSLNEQNINTVWFSRGDYFRMAAEIFLELNITPQGLNEDGVKDLSSRMKVKMKGYRLVPFDTTNGNHIKQTFENGSLAANYAQNDFLKSFINNLQAKGIEEYAPATDTVIVEGREKTGTIHIENDGNPRARIKIRRNENGLKDHITDDEIVQEFDIRDGKDERMLATLCQDSLIRVHLNDWSPEIDEDVNQYLTRLIIAYRNGELPPDFPPVGLSFGPEEIPEQARRVV